MTLLSIALFSAAIYYTPQPVHRDMPRTSVPIQSTRPVVTTSVSVRERYSGNRQTARTPVRYPNETTYRKDAWVRPASADAVFRSEKQRRAAQRDLEKSVYIIQKLRPEHW